MSEITPNYIGRVDADEKLKIMAAFQHWRKVLADPKFWDTVKAFQFKQTEMTSEQIAQKLYLGTHDGIVNLGMYRSWNPWSVEVAKSSNGHVWLNRWHFNKNSVQKVAGSLAHEYAHCLGFTHSYKPNADRDNSVPYVVGRLVSKWQT